MREGWKEVKIGELGKVVTGNTPPTKDPSNYGGSYPFIKPTDMVVGRRYVDSWEENYSDKAFERYKRSFIPPGSTGVVTIGTVGEKMFQADKWCFTNQSVNVVIPKEEYDNDFIYYLLKINLPKVENANPGTASGRHHVSKTSFCAIKLIVPESLKTQRKIASILSAYDDLIENNLKRIQLLEEQAQLTYEEWFVRFKFPGHEEVEFVDGLPEGWERKKIEDMIEVGRGSSPRPISDQKYFDDGVIPWLKIADATASHIYIYETKQYVNEYGASFSRKLPKGSIVVAASGTLGFPMILGVEACIHDGWLYFKGIDDKLKEYFYLSFIGLRKYFESISYGAAIQNINTGIVRQSPFIVPAEEVTIEFKKIASKLFESISNLQNQNQLLKEARDILLPRLMSGMIDPSASSGESVEKVLGVNYEKTEEGSGLSMAAEGIEKYGK